MHGIHEWVADRFSSHVSARTGTRITANFAPIVLAPPSLYSSSREETLRSIFRLSIDVRAILRFWRRRIFFQICYSLAGESLLGCNYTPIALLCTMMIRPPAKLYATPLPSVYACTKEEVFVCATITLV